MQSLAYAVAKQRMLAYARHLERLAEQIDALAIMFEATNDELKKYVTKK